MNAAAYWVKMNPRERALAGLTGALLAAGLAYGVVVPAQRYLQYLDEEIVAYEQQLTNDAMLMERAPAVDKAFAAIAAEHGSELTKYEIHDGLRKEIFRLTMRDMPATADAMTGTAAAGQQILQFIELPEGTLTEGEEGYREYAIEFTTRPGTLSDHMLFLRRIQDSPMSLRVTRFDMVRAPEANALVSAVIGLARTVVDGVPPEIAALAAGAVDALRNGGMEAWDEAAGPPGWTAEGVQLSRDTDHAEEGDYAVRVEATEDAGRFYQASTLRSGRTYRLGFVASAQGGATVSAGSGDEPYGEPVAIDGPLKRYTLRFAIPDADDGEAVRVPEFNLPMGSVAYIDDVTLDVVTE